MTLDKAILIASKAFEGKYDKGDVPYIMHCLHVMREVEHLGVEAQIAGVLHDLIEDTRWNAKMLLDEGFKEETVSLILLLTHGNESYKDYIMRLSLSPVARSIKMADIRHNSDVHRMKGLEEKDFGRIKKYHESYAFLRSTVD